MAMTFARHWPKSVNLTLYAEGFDPKLPTLHDIRSLPRWLTEFKLRHRTNPLHNGIVHAKPYQMLFDAVRFSHKVAAMTDAATDTQADVLIWADADIVTHAPVSEEFLAKLLPPEAALSWLWRSHKYPETGFIMFNMRHECTPRLLAAFKHLYTEDTLFGLNAWTDCHALQAAVDRMGAPWHSLSGEFHKTGHPFVNGILGTVMDHLKGERKRTGRSRRMDLKHRREEAYWRGVR
jgi:hypothetical protein